MKRIRLCRLSSQLLAPNRTATQLSRAPRICTSISSPPQLCRASYLQCQRRYQSAEASSSPVAEPDRSPEPEISKDEEPVVYSAKLAALHARLSLSPKIPVETLARALKDPSAGIGKQDNANLAFAGSTLLQYYVSEFLITRFPRLPMTILFAAVNGYIGTPTLHQVARAWGVEAAALPGEEVDPGYLQYNEDQPTVSHHRWGSIRAYSAEIQRYKWRRGMSSRIMYDDAFGEMVPGERSVEDKKESFEAANSQNAKDIITVKNMAQHAHANFVRAVVGAIYAHCGRDAVKSFVKAHFLSRTLDLASLFEFKLPTRELTRLCAREDFEPPVARLESETGRLSRTPVYVVGIYSGRDKLGEGPGPTLDSARTAAAINALKSWYLYSPGEVGVPSDTFSEDAEPWKPAYVDIGEIIA